MAKEKTGPNLYELLRERDVTLHSVYQQIMENHGELTPELEQQLNHVNPDLPQKVDGYHFFIEGSRHKAKELREIAKQATVAAKSLERVADRVEDRMADVMRSNGVNELTGNMHRFKFVGCQKRLEIDDSLLPSKYLMQVITHVPDKERIKAELLAGETIQGARLEGGTYLKHFLNTRD